MFLFSFLFKTEERRRKWEGMGWDGFVFLACELWFLSESFKENKADVAAFQEIKTILSRIMAIVQLGLCSEYQHIAAMTSLLSSEILSLRDFLVSTV